MNVLWNGWVGGQREATYRKKATGRSDGSYEKPTLTTQAGSSWRGSSPDSPTLPPLCSALPQSHLHSSVGGSLCLVHPLSLHLLKTLSTFKSSGS